MASRCLPTVADLTAFDLPGAASTARTSSPLWCSCASSAAGERQPEKTHPPFMTAAPRAPARRSRGPRARLHLSAAQAAEEPQEAPYHPPEIASR